MNAELSRLRSEHCEVLARLLCTDVKLRVALNSEFKGGPDEFLSGVVAWQRKRLAKVFVVLSSDHPVGLVSISPDPENVDGVMIGYWIGSMCWGRGIGTRVTTLALDYARSQGKARATAQVARLDSASARIWLRMGSSMLRRGATYRATLSLVDRSVA